MSSLRHWTSCSSLNLCPRATDGRRVMSSLMQCVFGFVAASPGSSVGGGSGELLVLSADAGEVGNQGPTGPGYRSGFLPVPLVDIFNTGGEVGGVSGFSRSLGTGFRRAATRSILKESVRSGPDQECDDKCLRGGVPGSALLPLSSGRLTTVVAVPGRSGGSDGRRPGVGAVPAGAISSSGRMASGLGVLGWCSACPSGNAVPVAPGISGVVGDVGRLSRCCGIAESCTNRSRRSSCSLSRRKISSSSCCLRRTSSRAFLEYTDDDDVAPLLVLDRLSEP